MDMMLAALEKRQQMKINSSKDAFSSSDDQLNSSSSDMNENNNSSSRHENSGSKHVVLDDPLLTENLLFVFYNEFLLKHSLCNTILKDLLMRHKEILVNWLI